MTEIRTNQRGPSQLHWQTHFLLAEKLGVWWRGGAVTANTLSTQAASVSCMCVYVLITQSCPTHCDPIDCSPPGSSVHGILQARILEWVASPFSRGSFRPRYQNQVSHIADRVFAIWATREASIS